MPPDGRLLPEDLLYELGDGVTVEWIEDSHWLLPHHVRVRDNSLFEFSVPGLDAAITDDLARAHSERFDVEIVNGTASSGRTRGLLNWSGILSVSGTVTNAQTFLNSVW
jgi:hypothetical protein